MERRNIILKTLDNQPRVLFWGLDEFLMMTIPLMVGLFFQGFFGFAIMFSGFPLKMMYAKFANQSRYFSFRSFIFWFLPKKKTELLLGVKNLPDSSSREILL
ncbi:MAG: type IV conjugative transfer system protein TraL [Nitrosopumilus sp.]